MSFGATGDGEGEFELDVPRDPVEVTGGESKSHREWSWRELVVQRDSEGCSSWEVRGLVPRAIQTTA